MKPLSIKNYIGFLLVILATVSWASSGIFINRVITKTGWSSVTTAVWRDLFTAITLGFILLIINRQGFKIRRKDIGWFVAMGVVSIAIFHVMWNSSVMNNGVGVATILQSNAPLFVAVTAYFLWREPFTPKKIIAIVLGIVGTLLLSDINSISTTNVTTNGILIGIGSAVTYSTMSIFGKKLSSDYDVWTVLFYAFVCAAVILFFTQFGEFNAYREMTEHALLDFIALILFPTVLGFWLYNTALKYLEASVAAITATSEVLFASIASFIFLDERMQAWQIVGGLLIVTGVVLVSIPRRKRKAVRILND
ncbi:MAG: DMT family transporter [Anaerolineales bacterium]